ncbi:MAG: YdcF family protein [Nitrospirae bacterium]|nr:YdcF family protein [Nitrospirota bacterium]
MKKGIRQIYWISLTVIIFLGLAAGAFFYAGYWLQNEDKPGKADAIIILSGELTRAFYAADLYRQGYAPQIYISKPAREHAVQMLDDIGIVLPQEEEICRKVLLKKGVRDKDIHIFSRPSLSTIEEAENLNKMFKGRQCRFLIITSPYHVRRAKMIFKKTLKNCEFKMLRTPYEPFSKKWWTNQDSARNVILETAKILFFQFGGRFRFSQ